jgi:hypothetical protein
VATRCEADRAEGKPLIRLGHEQVFAISKGYEGPTRRGGGNRIFPTTLTGWARKGLKAPDGELVFLDSIQVGCTLCTSVESIQRFCERLTPRQVASPQPTTRHLKGRLVPSSRSNPQTFRNWTSDGSSPNRAMSGIMRLLAGITPNPKVARRSRQGLAVLAGSRSRHREDRRKQGHHASWS